MIDFKSRFLIASGDICDLQMEVNERYVRGYVGREFLYIARIEP
jgi:hypothetical protein